MNSKQNYVCKLCLPITQKYAKDIIKIIAIIN